MLQVFSSIRTTVTYKEQKMPMVKGRKYPYTAKGKAAAAKAKAKPRRKKKS